jgi:hypothetical protein
MKQSATTTFPEKKKSGTTTFEEKKKKTAKSPVKVRVSDAQREEQPQQVKVLRQPRACDLSDPLKLLVFNLVTCCMCSPRGS